MKTSPEWKQSPRGQTHKGMSSRRDAQEAGEHDGSRSLSTRP